MSEPINTGWRDDMDLDDGRLDEFMEINAIEFPDSFHAFDSSRGFDPRDWMRIENQSRMGSCQGHSISSCLEHLYYVATGGEIIHFSRLFAYIATQRIDGITGDRGSTISGGAKLLKEYGLPLEDTVPYRLPYPSSAQRRQILSDENYQKAKDFRARTFVYIKSFDEAWKWITGGGALSIGISWPVSKDARGLVTRFSGGRGGGHAIYGGGALTPEMSGFSEPVIAWGNSHGENYGDEGWFYTTEKALESMLKSRNYRSCVGFSDMLNVTPRFISLTEYI